MALYTQRGSLKMVNDIDIMVWPKSLVALPKKKKMRQLRPNSTSLKMA